MGITLMAKSFKIPFLHFADMLCARARKSYVKQGSYKSWAAVRRCIIALFLHWNVHSVKLHCFFYHSNFTWNLICFGVEGSEFSKQSNDQYIHKSKLFFFYIKSVWQENYQKSTLWCWLFSLFYQNLVWFIAFSTVFSTIQFWKNYQNKNFHLWATKLQSLFFRP